MAWMLMFGRRCMGVVYRGRAKAEAGGRLDYGV
jgi:hypothetical protein